nr:ribonuclease H-like domain-containing protein [Tanacetum cinerariifolium]
MTRPDHHDPNAQEMKPWKRYCFHKFTMSFCYGKDVTEMQSLEIDDMLRIRLHEAGSNEEIFTFVAWIRAFNINEPIYVELCHEFYSAYEFDEVCVDDELKTKKIIKFRLGRCAHSLTLLEFARSLGLYQAFELEEEGFNAYFEGGLRSDEHFNAQYYSLSISREENLGLSRSHTSTIKNPILRVIHKVITYGLCQRTTGYDKIQKNDIWLLCMFDARHQSGVFTEDVMRSLSAPIHCRDLDTTMLRDLIDSDGSLPPTWDLNLKNVLGISEQCEGLYYYNDKDPVQNVLKDSLNIEKKDNTVCCEICQRAKQTRKTFPLSDHTSKRLDVNHINFFDIEYPEISNDDERVANDLNKDKSDSSGSSVSGSNINTVDFPIDSGRKAIGSKLIYKIKFKSCGEIDRYKARLVAQGFGQKEGIDYEETFSPVVKMVTDRCLLNITVSMSWHVFQVDVNNVFLYGDFEEVVFMKPPEGYYPSDNKFMHCHLSSHLKTAFKILRYLKSCPGLGIHITWTSGMFLNAYSGADWAKCIITRKSFTRYCGFLNNSFVSWKISLHCDNNSAIKIAANPVFHERTKHLEIDLHFVREKILKGVVKTVKVDFANQIAEILTKGLDSSTFRIG